MESKSNKIKEKLLYGLFPAVPTIFNKGTEKLDLEANEKLATFLSKQPIEGVAIWVHTGRGPFLEKDEKKEIAAIWKGHLKDGLIIGGVGASSKPNKSEKDIIKEAIENAEFSLSCGIDAILVFPPSPFKGSWKDILKYHELIAEVGLPIILFYLYEEAGGILYDLGLLDELLNIEGVVGIKLATLYSITRLQDILKFLTLKHPDKIPITGEDRAFGYSIMRGAKSALIGLGTIMTDLQKDMMTSFFEKDYSKFVELALKVDDIAESIFVEPMEGYIIRLLYSLHLIGIIEEKNIFDPYGPSLTEEDKKRISNVLKNLGVIK